MSISPRTLRGGLVLVDAGTLAPRPNGVVALQYNSDSLARTLTPAAVGGDGQDRSEALRLKGPPVETIKLEAELDAADQLERGDPTAARYGILPQLAVLELMAYPPAARLAANRALAAAGTLEILPLEAPLTLFVWSRSRILPVRVTEFGVTEEAFDPDLNPIRAKVSLGLRVLSPTDLGPDHRGSELFDRYHRLKEDLAGKGPRFDFANLGIGGVT
jgi:hypothetical protein